MSTIQERNNEVIITVLPPLPEPNNNNSRDNFETHESNIRLMSIIIVMIITLPFIFVDLYLGFSDNSCLYINTGSINMSINTWLLVIGFYNSGLLILLSYIILKKKDLIPNWIIFYKFMMFVSKVFTLVWLIIGAVIFWKYTEPYCSKMMTEYMWCRLIIGLITLVTSYKKNKN